MSRSWTRTYQTLQQPIIQISNATFYRQSADTSEAIFPGLNFTLSRNSDCWSVISPSSVARTTFLRVLAGHYVCSPPRARTYPSVTKSLPQAIRYVGFDTDRGGNSVRGAYLSARYESRREETDFSVLDYLLGHTELNPLDRPVSDESLELLDKVVKLLNLENLLQMPFSNLSNGQTRRSRIARSLLDRPEALLLDGPFMGLDPNTSLKMSSVLKQVSEQQTPRLVMSLRPEDKIPEWVTHVVLVNDGLRIVSLGKKGIISKTTPTQPAPTQPPKPTLPAPPLGEPLVEMRGVKVSYGTNTVLGAWGNGLWWTLHRGQRYGIFGPNGSGKTTLLSLITSDHPQTYSLPIKVFGRSRLPAQGERGISVFDLQRRIGHSSPEVHAFFPKHLHVRRALESAWGDAPLSRPVLDEEQTRRVDAVLRYFAWALDPEGGVDATQPADIAWARETPFGELSFSSQRLLLFLRAVIHSPDLVILDEALSGIDARVRDAAMLFLSHGFTREDNDTRFANVEFRGLTPHQALVVISHSKEDVPDCVKEWITLPEPGTGKEPRMGVLEEPLRVKGEGWDEIWDVGR